MLGGGSGKRGGGSGKHGGGKRRGGRRRGGKRPANLRPRPGEPGSAQHSPRRALGRRDAPALQLGFDASSEANLVVDSLSADVEALTEKLDASRHAAEAAAKAYTASYGAAEAARHAAEQDVRTSSDANQKAKNKDTGPANRGLSGTKGQ